MNNKTRFLQYLSSEWSIDYWSDIGIDHAVQLAKQLSSAEWMHVCTNWEQMHEIVQVRLAEVASEVIGDSDDIVSMLFGMLSSESPEIVEASVDSLHAILEHSPERVNRTQLANLLRDVIVANQVAAVVLQSLKQRVEEDS